MTARIGVLQLQVRDGGDVLAHRREGIEDRRKLIQVIRRGSPPCDITAHGNEDEAEPAHWFGRGLLEARCRRNHRLQQRQGQRRTDTAQESPARESFFGEDHNDFLMVNGVLWVMAMIREEKRSWLHLVWRMMLRMAGPS
jgi:hypothetical protein